MLNDRVPLAVPAASNIAFTLTFTFSFPLLAALLLHLIHESSYILACCLLIENRLPVHIVFLLREGVFVFRLGHMISHIRTCGLIFNIFILS